jgi:thioester reductase-like protein
MTDLRTYITLPDDLGEPAAGAVPDRPSRILLTGATGYLGAYLLCSLLERSDATIVCLVRAADVPEGLARLQANLARYELVADLSRVEVLRGAIEQKRLGLDESTWQSLARDIDAIVHTAADVNFMRSLDQLLAVNVGGAVNLLRLAGHARPKPVHLASSYSVFNEASYNGVAQVTEESLVGDGVGFRHAYPMSKWIAERVTDLARPRGWNITTHRLGLLWGDARTGRAKADDALTLSVRACLTLGRAYDSDSLMHVTPVDFAAAAVAAVALAPALSPRLGNGYYHEITETPIAWGDFIRAIQRQGHAIDFVSQAAWQDALRAALPAHRELAPLVLLGAQSSTRNNPNVSSMRFDASRLRAALAGTGIACPPLDNGLIATYLGAIANRSAPV